MNGLLLIQVLARMPYQEYYRFKVKYYPLVTSYKAARRMVKPFLLKPQIFHSCENDCILYCKQYEKNMACPICAAPRYKWLNVPVKKLTYLPLGPRLIRLFSNKKTAKELQSHSNGLPSNGISLAFCTDGVNPFNHVVCIIPCGQL